MKFQSLIKVNATHEVIYEH